MVYDSVTAAALAGLVISDKTKLELPENMLIYLKILMKKPSLGLLFAKWEENYR